MKYRQFERHASSLLIGALFFSVSGILYLSFCSSDLSQDQTCQHLQKHAESLGNSQHSTDRLHAYLLVIILSTPAGRAERDTLRQTWLQLGSGNVTHRFMVGTKQLQPEVLAHLRQEQAQQRDLVLLQDLEDSYQHLTSKLLKSLIWADAHSEFNFLLKADEDSFVRLDDMVVELGRKPAYRLYWGFFSGRAHVYTKGKWREKSWKLCDRYLPYAKGGGYVLSHDLVHFVANNAHYLKKYLSEDITLGSWLAPIELNYVHDPRFDTEYKSRGCNNKYLVTHKQTRAMMRDKFDSLKVSGQLCKKEFRTMNSYVYNWDVPPSQCCDRSDSSIP